MRRLPIWWFVAMFVAAAYCVVIIAFRDNHPGGMRLEFALDTIDDLDARATEVAAEMERILADHHVAGKVTVGPPAHLAVQLDDQARLRDVDDELAKTAERKPCATRTTACYQLRDLTDAQLRDTLERALPAIRERVSEKGVETGVFIERDRIVVEIVGDREIAVELAALIERRAKLEMKVVDDCAIPAACTAQAVHTGSPFMKLVYAKASHDPAATTADISTGVDTWRPEDGGAPHTDYYLRAADREETVTPDEAKRIGCPFVDRPCTVTGKRVIERYLAGLAAADPAFQIPDDRQIAFERVEPPPDAKDQRPYWRSYYLDRRPRLTGAAIAKATGSYDANTNRPIILLDLTRPGGQAFGDLTAEIVGMKLATLLDGTIKSAPLIQGPIRGGRVSITMGGTYQERAERERSDLIAVIGAGAMPPLREESAREFPGLTGVAWPKLVPGLAVLLGLVAFALLRRRAA